MALIPWFNGQPTTQVLLYRVNRRPRWPPTIRESKAETLQEYRTVDSYACQALRHDRSGHVSPGRAAGNSCLTCFSRLTRELRELRVQESLPEWNETMTASGPVASVRSSKQRVRELRIILLCSQLSTIPHPMERTPPPLLQRTSY